MRLNKVYKCQRSVASLLSISARSTLLVFPETFTCFTLPTLLTRSPPQSTLLLELEISLVEMTTTPTIAYHAKTVFLFTNNKLNDIVVRGVMFGALHGQIASSLSIGPSLS